MPTYFHPPRVVVHCLSPAPHLNVKPSPGGSHLSLGGTNTISKHQSPQRHTLARCLLCARPLNLLLHTPKLFHEGALEGLSAVTANFANKKYIAPTACRLSDGDGMRVCVCLSEEVSAAAGCTVSVCVCVGVSISVCNVCDQ